MEDRAIGNRRGCGWKVHPPDLGVRHRRKRRCGADLSRVSPFATGADRRDDIIISRSVDDADVRKICGRCINNGCIRSTVGRRSFDVVTGCARRR